MAKSDSLKNRAALEKFLAPLEMALLDARMIWHYGDIRASLEKRGQPIVSLDTLIAAQALTMAPSSRALPVCRSKIGDDQGMGCADEGGASCEGCAAQAQPLSYGPDQTRDKTA